MILFNFSSNTSGGGMYHAHKFINEISNYFQKDEIIIVINNEIILNNIDFTVFKVNSPAKSLKSRKIILGIVSTYNVDVVYTMAGPSYINFNCIHIMGISNAWLLNVNTKLLYSTFKWSFVKEYLRIKWSRYNCKNAADIYVFQTIESMRSFNKELKLNPQKSVHIPNAYIDRSLLKNKPILLKKGHISIVIPSSFYPHKGLDDVIWLIKKMGNELNNKYCFFFTVPNEYENKYLIKIKNLSKKIKVINIGKYNPEEEYSIMSQCDIILLPSKLETFSSSHLEAALTEKIIISRKEPFATNICGEDAYYFSSREDLFKLFKDINYLTRTKTKTLNSFISYNQRCEMIVNLIKKNSNNK